MSGVLLRTRLRRERRRHHQPRSRELLGWEASESLAKVDEIYYTVLDIFRTASAEGIPTYKAADRLAEKRFTSV